MINDGTTPAAPEERPAHEFNVGDYAIYKGYAQPGEPGLLIRITHKEGKGLSRYTDLYHYYGRPASTPDGPLFYANALLLFPIGPEHLPAILAE